MTLKSAKKDCEMTQTKTGETVPRARGNLVAKVVAELREQVESGALCVGDRLPSEARLTELFSVSRTVIREAIATLRADGLVEPRQGSGVFVLAPADIEARPFQIIDADKISSIIEMLELRVAVRAASVRARPQHRQLHCPHLLGASRHCRRHRRRGLRRRARRYAPAPEGQPATLSQSFARHGKIDHTSY
jgi:DNA-binding transcriptional regulator YhcF (GntR family)